MYFNLMCVIFCINCERYERYHCLPTGNLVFQTQALFAIPSNSNLSLSSPGFSGNRYYQGLRIGFNTMHNTQWTVLKRIDFMSVFDGEFCLSMGVVHRPSHAFGRHG